MIAPYLGAALRALGGDLNESGRAAVWGGTASAFGGGELGSLFQFGSLLLDARITALTNLNGGGNQGDAHVNGLKAMPIA
jgi:hypothetical protein